MFPKGTTATIAAMRFRILLAEYSECTNRGQVVGDAHGESAAACGGIQQLLNNNVYKHPSTIDADDVTVHRPTAQESSLLQLPDSLQLMIISLLDVTEICRLASVCSHWHQLTADRVLWRQRLESDVGKWPVIGHLTNPDAYRESDWTDQQIYLRCCPRVNTAIQQSNNSFHQLSTLLRYMLPQKTPKIAMFGPGLESNTTSGIARHILHEQHHNFKVTGTFPGQFAGLGSGFNLLTPDGVAFRLITLYSSTKRERINATNLQRLQNSRLLQSPGDEEGHYMLRPSVKDLCFTLDACIFVLDASATNSDEELRAELLALVEATGPHAPLVVLACVPTVIPTTERTTSIDVARQLRLNQLHRPWQVHHCVVDSMSGVAAAITWLIEQSQRS